MLKMATANRVFETLPEMEAAIEQEMRPLWNTPARVHSLIGDNAVHSQTNVTSKKLTSGFQLELVSDARGRAGALGRRVSEAKFQPLTRHPATENTRPNALA
jgi:hypothetical protein